MARITVDTTQVDAIARDIQKQSRNVHPRLRQVLRKVSFDVERQVKTAMPVLSGRARASWGHWTPGDLTGGGLGASAADAYLEETDTAIEQGTNLDYVEDLNSGSSQKAPAGFIDAAFVRGERALQAAVDAVAAQAANWR